MRRLIFTQTILTMMFLSCQNHQEKTTQLNQDTIHKTDTIIHKVLVQSQDSIISKPISKRRINTYKQNQSTAKFYFKKNNIKLDSLITNHCLVDTSLIVQTPKSATLIDERFFLPNTPISNLINKLRPASQTFNIENWKDTLIVSNNGTTFAISKNSFINSLGQIPQFITITLVEITSIADILNANLQTTSDDNILQTGGMFFIDAKETKSSLDLVSGKTIYVDFKTSYKDSKMMLFNGTFNHVGNINWMPSGVIDNKLIPIPLNLLNFKQGGMECSLSQEELDLLNKKEYENTFIATREFEERTSSVFYIAACEQYKGLSQKLIEIYTTNLNQNLFFCDSLAADLIYKTYRKEIDTTKKFTFEEDGWVSYFYKAFIDFKNQRLTKVINFEQIGVTEKTTIENLIDKGYSEVEATSIVNYYKTQQQLIKYKIAERSTSKLASYSFSLNKLGWINVDQSLEGEYLKNSEFVVKTISQDTLDFVSVSLVIPRYNVSIFTTHQDGNIYSFTKKKDGYRKLPVGQDAIIVAFAYKNNTAYFGKRKITIPKNGTIEIGLNMTTEQVIKQKILKLNE